MPTSRRNWSLWGLGAVSIVLAVVTAGFLWLQYKPMAVKDVALQSSPFERLENAPHTVPDSLPVAINKYSVAPQSAPAEEIAHLDSVPGAWDQRLERYRMEKSILKAAGLSETELDQALVRLRERLFKPDELRRVEALDRLAEG